MNIVYFIDHLRPDGAQFVLSQLVDGMSERGHSQIVVCLNDTVDSPILDHLQASDAEVHIIGKKALLTGQGLLKIWKMLKYRPVDVVVTILFVADILGRVMGRMTGVPRIVTSIQTHDIFYTFWQRWLERRTARLSDLVLIASENYREFTIKEEGIPPERIQVLYNSIQVSDYQNPISSALFLEEIGLETGAKVIGYAGRLTEQKGLDVLLAAFALLPNLKTYLWIAGVGEEENALRRKSLELGVAERVIFAGFRRDLPRWLGALHVYVQPSRYEGMPLSVLQAMSAACPIVATAVDGNCELIEDGVSGWLVPPEDPRQLSLAIQSALDHPDEALRRGKAARQRSAAHFNQDVILDKWEKAFSGL